MFDKQSLIAEFRLFLAGARRALWNTCSAYCSDIEFFLSFLEKKKKKLDFLVIRDFEFFGQQQIKKGLSPKTVARRLAAIRTFADFLRQTKNISLKLTGVATPKIPKTLPRFLTEAQIQLLFSFAELNSTFFGQTYFMLIKMLYSLGLRVSEVIAIKLAHINFSNATIKIFGKGQKQRIIPLPDTLIEKLQDYVSNQRQKFLHQQNINPDILFFSYTKQALKPMTRNQVSQIVEHTSLKAGLKLKVSPHMLRHSIATHLLAKGANLRMIQLFLGHTDIATVQIYTHIQKDHLRKIYDLNHPLK